MQVVGRDMAAYLVGRLVYFFQGGKLLHILDIHYPRTNKSIYNYSQGLRSKGILSGKEKRHRFCNGKKKGGKKG